MPRPLDSASPGIRIKEIDLTLGSIVSASDKVAGIVGPFSKGPVDLPTSISNENDLLNVFGEPYSIDNHYEHWLTASSYLSYGGSLRVVRSDNEGLRNGYIGESNSIKIKSLEHYRELNYDDNPLAGVLFSARNPGSWSNGIRVSMIDSKSDQILKGIDTSQIQVGYAVTQSLSGVDNPGIGTISVLNGYLRGFVSEVSEDSIEVKVFDYVSDSGISYNVDYQPGGIYKFSDSGIIGIGTTNIPSSYSSSLDWFDQQTIQLTGIGTTGNIIKWNSIAPRPQTTQYAVKRNSRFDELHIVVIDSLGTISGNVGTILEKHLNLSKASDAEFSVGTPSYWRKYIENNSNYIFAFDLVPIVTLEVTPESVIEDGTINLLYKFTRVGSIAPELTVNYTVSGTAIIANDYTGISTEGIVKTVTFAPGSSTVIVTVNPVADFEYEDDETVTLTLVSGIGYIIGSPSEATGTITNDDLPIVTVAVSPESVIENDGNDLIYTFSRTGITISTLNISYIVGGTAGLGTDYTGISTEGEIKTITFGPGDSTVNLTVSPISDSENEDDETVIVTIIPDISYSIGISSEATGTITNDDLPIVEISVSPSSVAEDDEIDLVYTFTRTGTTTPDLDVNYIVSGTAGLGTDYTGISTEGTIKTVTIGSGSTVSTVTVSPILDIDHEDNETVILTLISDPSYIIGISSEATGTILNDDPLPTITVTVSPESVEEDGGIPLTYTFARTGSTSATLLVDYIVSGTAGLGTDYTGISTEGTIKTITFNPGDSTIDLIVNPIIDSENEDNETIVINLASGLDYILGSPSQAIGTITNDDLPTITIDVSPSSVSEDANTDLVYTFTRTGTTTPELNVNYIVSGTAGLGTDYTGISTEGGIKTVTFISGSSTSTVTASPIPDVEHENNETVILTLVSDPSYIIGISSEATGTILNDDFPIITVTASPESVLEDSGLPIIYTFNRTGMITSELTVNYLVSGTAGLGTDYTGISTEGSIKTITFGVGLASSTVTVTPTLDIESESNETVIITLDSGTGYTVGIPSTAIGTITNDDIVLSTQNLYATFTVDDDVNSIVLVKFDVDGDIIWQKEIDSVGDYESSGSLSVDENENAYFIGNRGYTPLVIKFDPNGNIIWQKLLPTPIGYYGSFGVASALDNSGNLYFGGGMYGEGVSNGNIIKFDSSTGSKLWETGIQLGAFNAYVSDLKVDSNDNLYVIGNTGSTNAYDIFVIKFDSGQNVVWQKRIGEQPSDVDWGYGISLGSDGNIYITGYQQYSYVGFALKPFIMAFNPSGTLLFQKEVDIGGYQSWFTAKPLYIENDVLVLCASGDYTNPTTRGTVVRIPIDQLSTSNGTYGPFEVIDGRYPITNETYTFATVTTTITNANYVATSGQFVETLAPEYSGGDYDLPYTADVYYSDLNTEKWVLEYGPDGFGVAFESSVIDVNDNIYVVGSMAYDGNPLMVKFDSDGNIVWQKLFRNPTSGKLYSYGELIAISKNP